MKCVSVLHDNTAAAPKKNDPFEVRVAQGELIDAEGTYVGGLRGGLRHGKGTLSTLQGDVWHSSFKQGLAEGAAVIDYSNGDRYEGQVSRGRLSGKGLLTRSSEVYSGEWAEGLRDGEGRVSWAPEIDATLPPRWFEGGPARRGVVYLGHYEGKWRQDTMDGPGRLVGIHGEVTQFQPRFTADSCHFDAILTPS